MVPVLTNVGERATAKNYHSISLLSVLSKGFEKLLNNRFFDHPEKCRLFLISSMILRLLDQLQMFWVVSDRIARDFNKSRATRAAALDISKAFDRVWHAGLLHKLNSFGISGQLLALFCLFWVIEGFKWFWTGSLHQNFQVMLEFIKAPFLVLNFSYYTLMTFLMILYVILLSMLINLLSTLRDQAFDLRQQLELDSESESIGDIVHWDRKWFADFNAGKTQFVLFEQSNNNGAIDLKIDGFVLKEKSYFKILGLPFSSKLDLTLSLLLALSQEN